MKRPLMAFGIALVGGAAMGWQLPAWWFMLTAVTVYGIYCKFFWADSSWKYHLGLSALLIVGFCRTLSVQHGQPELSKEVTGEIYKIQEKEKCWYVYLQLPEKGRVLIIVMNEDVYEGGFYKGQVLWISGEAEVFRPPGNPGQFDERAYYLSQGVGYKIWAENIELVSEGGFLARWLRPLETLGRKMSDFYKSEMSEAGAGVLQAAVLGERSGFSGDLRRYYQENGWLHLVTVSGLHLSFLVSGFYRKIRKAGIPPLPGMLAALLVMAGYGYMINLGDSMRRAMGMMILFFAGEFFGRKVDGPTAIVITGACMLMIRPERIYSVGFLLSFAAAGGMELGGILQNGGNLSKRFGKIKAFVYMQSGIFLSTLPLVVWYMYEIPLFGFFYNFFMIPLVSLLVPSAFLAALAGIFGIPFLADGSVLLLKLADGLLSWVHSLPSAVWICGRPALWQLYLYIFCTAAGILLLQRCKRRHSFAVLVLSCLFLSLVRIRQDRIICMDVGQGDGICIMEKGGRTLFIDGGSSDVKSLYTYRIEPMLKYYGIKKVDVWFLTHGDKDHVSGVQELLERGERGFNQLVLPKVTGDEVLNDISRAAEGRGIDVSTMGPGDFLRCGRFRLDCLAPGREMEDKNNNSMVLLLERESFSMLFAGDLEVKGEAALLQRWENIKCHILKAGHHGSSGATSEEFLHRTAPEWAIISCGEANVYGHPHEEMLMRLKAAGCEWVTTAKQGAVIIEFDGQVYILRGYKEP